MYWSLNGNKLCAQQQSLSQSNQHIAFSNKTEEKKLLKSSKCMKFSDIPKQQYNQNKLRNVSELNIQRSLKRMKGMNSTNNLRSLKQSTPKTNKQNKNEKNHIKNQSPLFTIIKELKDFCHDIKQIYYEMKALFTISKTIWQIEFKKLQQDQNSVFDRISSCYSTLQKNIDCIGSPKVKVRTLKNIKSQQTLHTRINKGNKNQGRLIQQNQHPHDNLQEIDNRIFVSFRSNQFACNKNSVYSKDISSLHESRQQVQNSKSQKLRKCSVESINMIQQSQDNKKYCKKIVQQQINNIDHLLNKLKKLAY